MISSRPLIGLSGRRKLGAQVAGFPRSLGHLDIDVYVSDYARAISAAGGLPVHLPQHVDPAEYAGRLDGLLLSGGADVHPSLYGAESETDAYPPEPERDRAELGLIDVAVDEGIPVLGICRGLQLLNVWGGGSLHQHVPEHARYDTPPHDRVDELALEAGSRLFEMYGAHHTVNSLHHQTVDRVAPGWSVVARSTDGTVEALEWPGHDVIAVQWHPELLAGASTDPIFAWLVERAGALTTAASDAVRRALSSSDAEDLLRAEHDVEARLRGLGIDVDLDFPSMAAVANVFRVASAARSHLERTVLAGAGLSFTAFTVMWVLWVWGEMESCELAIDAGITKGTLTGVVGTLEGRGLVRRRRDDVDGRLVRVSTTAEGERLMVDLFARFNEGEARVVAALDGEECEQLAHLLRKVLREMEEVDDATTR